MKEKPTRYAVMIVQVTGERGTKTRAYLNHTVAQGEQRAKQLAGSIRWRNPHTYTLHCFEKEHAAECVVGSV